MRAGLDGAVIARIRAEMKAEDPSVITGAELRRLRAEALGEPTAAGADVPAG